MYNLMTFDKWCNYYNFHPASSLVFFYNVLSLPLTTALSLDLPFIDFHINAIRQYILCLASFTQHNASQFIHVVLFIQVFKKLNFQFGVIVESHAC